MDVLGCEVRGDDDRERVGNSGYRIIYDIGTDMMTAVAVLPKSDTTYDLQGFGRRLNRS